MARRRQYYREKKQSGALIAMFVGAVVGLLIILGGDV